MSAVQCGACLRAYSRSDWEVLPLVHSLSGREVGRILVGWHEARAVEVRACRGCGRAIARATSIAEAPSAGRRAG